MKQRQGSGAKSCRGAKPGAWGQRAACRRGLGAGGVGARSPARRVTGRGTRTQADVTDPARCLRRAAARWQGPTAVWTCVESASATAGTGRGPLRGPDCRSRPQRVRLVGCSSGSSRVLVPVAQPAVRRRAGWAGNAATGHGGSARRASPGRGLWSAGAFGVRAITNAAALELGPVRYSRGAADRRRRHTAGHRALVAGIRRGACRPAPDRRGRPLPGQRGCAGGDTRAPARPARRHLDPLAPRRQASPRGRPRATGGTPAAGRASLAALRRQLL